MVRVSRNATRIMEKNTSSGFANPIFWIGIVIAAMLLLVGLALSVSDDFTLQDIGMFALSLSILLFLTCLYRAIVRSFAARKSERNE